MRGEYGAYIANGACVSNLIGLFSLMKQQQRRR
jgi:hypothetical protein